MSMRVSEVRILIGLALFGALVGCVRQEALYPVVVPLPKINTVTIRDAPVPEKPKELSAPLPAPVIVEGTGEKEASPVLPDVQPMPPPEPSPPEEDEGVVEKMPAPRGARSYFVNREVMSNNIKMFPRWTSMMARFNAEAHTLDSMCGPDLHTPCKLKEWKGFLEGLREAPLMEKLREVNRTLNKYPYVDDVVNWGIDNYWETPYEFQRKGGNCKDYAIAKYMSLRAIGVPSNIMRITVLRDLNLGGIIHAVLVVSDGEKSYILDNQIKQVVPTDKVYHYMPIYSINEEHWWQHFMLE